MTEYNWWHFVGLWAFIIIAAKLLRWAYAKPKRQRMKNRRLDQVLP